MAGGPETVLPNLCALPDGRALPFRRMFTHPQLLRRLQWMLGDRFRAFGTSQTVGRAVLSAPGACGHPLHSGRTQLRGAWGNYAIGNGRSYVTSVNVAWQLRDVTASDGGYCAVLGSHKAREPPPGARTTNIDLPHVVHVPLRRGDCLCFMGSAQMHGAFAWQGEAGRRACLFNYMARDRPGPRL